MPEIPNIINIINKNVKDGCRNLSITELEGDASDRRYFRASFNNNSGKTASIIIMALAKPEKGELPFVNVQRILIEKNIPAPEIYHYEKRGGIILLEDCGNLTLEEWVSRTSNMGENETIYKKAIDIILDMQCKVRKEDRECIAFKRFFDEEKLMWELEFTLKHFVQGYLGKTVTSKDSDCINKGFRRICMELAKQKRVFTHRDYHSRNIMVEGERLTILDFQDARMGPCQYDLVSLLRDSYVTLPDDLVYNLIDYYVSKKEKTGEKISREAFMRVFNLMSIQRNLKAIGTFAYQKIVKGNDKYIRHIPSTLDYINRNLIKYDDMEELKVIAKYLVVS